MHGVRVHRWLTLLALFAIMLALAAPAGAPVALASHTASPTAVTLAGSLQDDLGVGCSEWTPSCAGSYLADQGNDVWRAQFNVPAGSWEYKMALNNAWDESYAGNHTANGNTTLTTASAGQVRFYYDHKTHAVLDSVMDKIAVAAGSFQDSLGCSGEWQPDCVRTLLTDADGDGTYSFESSSIPAGSYEFKVALNEGWAESYPAANASFTVGALGQKVTITWNATSHAVNATVASGSGSDNNVQWDGLRHDSRDTLYRTPGGAVPAGTPVTLRLRTFHDDVTAVGLRVYSFEDAGQTVYPMQRAASDVSCYQAGLGSKTCDFWEYTLPNATPDNLWYRFVVTDGSDTDYYADNTRALDGGLGTTSDDPVDDSYALMVHTPGFAAPAWAKNAVIYQIFPDRFRNGRADNDAKTGDVRYDDPVLALPWGTKPEGYCRNYADGAANCPWRFDTTPPADSPTKEQPRGRDYMGGDLKGVDQQLDYLAGLGVNTIYFNPIFDAGSNHSYDTQDYYKIDPYFGTQKDWENLVKHANQLGIKIILDGVFNHMSSDSPIFDRYGHYSTVGACESISSPYRSWFNFQEVAAGTGTCAGTAGAKSATYDGWFGFDSIPVLNKSLAAVQQYFVTSPNSVAKTWLTQGAGGWRMDVSGDPSFPDGYWQSFRTATKGQRPDALLISETWQKDSTLLRMLRGDRLDTTMNYRLRDAVIGLLAPGSFDSKGFPDSGDGIEPSEFAARLASVREDYPDAAYYSLMNLLDSHDTERLLWTLTPGEETTAGRELNATNLAAGKLRVRLASLIQFTVPGAPTVYYGDEVGLTGDDDPDDRRTYPWTDLGGSPDTALFNHYKTLASLRKANAALTTGDFQVLLADDAADTVAYGRRTGTQGAIVAINRSGSSRTLQIPVAGYLNNGTVLSTRLGVGASGGNYTVANGAVEVTLPAMSGLLLATGTVDLTPPAAPANLRVTAEGDSQISLAWNAVAGAAGYNIYHSPLSGGGWVKVNGSPLSGTSYTDTGLTNARTYYYMVRALDAAGNESATSNQVAALPHLTIGWANLQWPPTLAHTISATNRTDNVYGQVYIEGATNQPGATDGLQAQLGFGPAGTNPATNAAWRWIDATFNTNAGNNDEFVASMLPDAVGSYDYVYRYTTTAGRAWLYADLNGPIANGVTPANPGKLTVNPSSDTTPPAAPTGLQVVTASPAGIELKWNAVADPTLYGYEVRRSASAGGQYTTLVLVTGATSYVDTAVTEGATYHYVVRAVDTSFNRSSASAAVSAKAELRTVTLRFNVTVPAYTDAIGPDVHIAGFLDRLDGNLPQWDPAGVALEQVDATHWAIEFTGKEGTQIDYKYALGTWDYVEKDASCGEIDNRALTLSYGSNGTQVVADTVQNWRNSDRFGGPCGN
jgi:glycosidase/fibronectin type 3 domain-containing protein